MGSKLAIPTLKQPAFDCSPPDKYTQLTNFRLEVITYLRHTIYIVQTEYILSKNWLGRQGLQFLKVLTQEEPIIVQNNSWPISNS